MKTSFQMNGSFPVDLFELTADAADYLEGRGAIVSSSKHWGRVEYDVQFPGCKPNHNSGMGMTRVFFPDEDSILLFSMVFGHLIQNCRVVAIQDMILKERIMKE